MAVLPSSLPGPSLHLPTQLPGPTSAFPSQLPGPSLYLPAQLSGPSLHLPTQLLGPSLYLPVQLRNQILSSLPLSELQRWDLASPPMGRMFSLANCRELLRQRYHLTRDQLARWYDWLVEPLSPSGTIGYASKRDQYGIILLMPMQALIKIAAYCGEVTINSDLFLDSNSYSLLLLRNYLACRTVVNQQQLLTVLSDTQWPTPVPQHLFYFRLLFRVLLRGIRATTISIATMAVLLREAITADVTELVALILTFKIRDEFVFDLKLSPIVAMQLWKSTRNATYKGYHDRLVSEANLTHHTHNESYNLGLWYAGARNMGALANSEFVDYLYRNFLDTHDWPNLAALQQLRPPSETTDNYISVVDFAPHVITAQMIANVPQLQQFVLKEFNSTFSKHGLLRQYAVLLNQPIELLQYGRYDQLTPIAYAVGHRQLLAIISNNAEQFHPVAELLIVSDIIYQRQPLESPGVNSVRLMNAFRMGRQLQLLDNSSFIDSNLLYATAETININPLDVIIAQALLDPASSSREKYLTLVQAVALKQRVPGAIKISPHFEFDNIATWYQLFPEAVRRRLLSTRDITLGTDNLGIKTALQRQQQLLQSEKEQKLRELQKLLL